MQMVARVRLVVDVPFYYDVAEQDASGHSPSRRKAAKHAETNLLDGLAKSVKDGTVVKSLSLVEEVREA